MLFLKDKYIGSDKKYWSVLARNLNRICEPTNSFLDVCKEQHLVKAFTLGGIQILVI